MNQHNLYVVPKPDLQNTTEIKLPKEFELVNETSRTREFSYSGSTDTAFIIPVFQEAAFDAGAKSASYNAGTERYTLSYDHTFSRD